MGVGCLSIPGGWWVYTCWSRGVRPLRSCRVTESYRFVPAVSIELVLWELRRLSEPLLWTVFGCLRIFLAQWWRCIMSSGTGSPTTEQAGRTPAVPEPIPGILRGFDFILQSDCFYDLNGDIQDVFGLRAVQPEVAVAKVMSVLNNRCVRVVIPDNNIGTDGFHEVLIHDMADVDAPDMPVSELGSSSRLA